MCIVTHSIHGPFCVYSILCFNITGSVKAFVHKLCNSSVAVCSLGHSHMDGGIICSKMPFSIYGVFTNVNVTHTACVCIEQ